jgi:carboxylate-amine ligase
MSTTIGVEEEFHVVDPVTRRIVPRAPEVLGRIDPLGGLNGAQFQSEIHRTMVETCTTICTELSQAAAQLQALRDTLKGTASEQGLRIAAAGSLPIRATVDTLEDSDDRYNRISELHGEIVAAMSTCGTHVHIGVDDRDQAVQVMNRVRRWLPALLALSASSPFWDGHDTGYASYRTIVWGRWPSAHIPEPFIDAAQHDAVVSALIDSGAILDRGQIYWDVRLSAAHPTLEFRVADVPMTVDETILQAGLCRALVQTALHQIEARDEESQYRPELLRAAKWRAARYGMDDRLLDLDALRLVPAREEVMGLLTHVADALAQSGDTDLVTTLMERTLRDGTGAARQRAQFLVAGSAESVVDMVVDAT